MDLSPTPIHRRTSSGDLYRYGLMELNSSNLMMMEKRQLFLRSYQFSRKKSLAERIKRSLTRVKRVFWIRLRSTHKIRKFVWSRLRFLILYHRKKRFIRLLNNQKAPCFGWHGGFA